ncbi:MAG: radical SAM protein [Verrucomicrobia bacterium]|nr:radical SAM protein [Verrucomicrobiota bacterium]MDA1087280.1 radical SAM protein [Verrucomicrobiota bacterium]
MSTTADTQVDNSWMQTADGQPRGYIQPSSIRELWFHTGTTCNLSCPFCLEGSKPGDNRLNRIRFEDAKPFIDEALELGVQQFSFTGGEPFVIRDMIRILEYALEHRPCLVLTNGTDPLIKRMHDVVPLLDKPNPLALRISIDYPDATLHDAGRGAGNFDKALDTVRALHEHGFRVSLARQMPHGEDSAAADRAYRSVFKSFRIPEDTNIVAFPDFLSPGSPADIPQITESCMTQYHSEKSRDEFMCTFSKMIVKKEGRMRVYACTLVDDDEEYDLGGSLEEAMPVRVMLKHHRCYSCFAYGASCSEG